MRSNSVIPALVLLTLTACGGTMWVAPEDQMMPARRVTGDVARDEASLAGGGSLSAAASAQVVSLDDDGTQTVVGAASVEADGSFAIDAEGMTRTFVVQVLDESGALMGATVVSADAATEGDIDAGTVGAETSIEAAVWTELVAQAGYGLVVSSEVRARIDATTSAAAQAWFDAHGESTAAFSAMADAMVGASIARQDQIRASGVSFGAHAQGELRGWLDGVGSASELSAAVDAALEADGVAAADRSTVAARTEATFRAALAGALLGGDLESEAIVDAGASSSAVIEAWGHANAWAALADSEGGDSQLLVGLQAELIALTEGAQDSGTTRAALHAAVEASVETLVDGLLQVDAGLDLGLLLGGDRGSDVDQEQAVGEWTSALHAELEASVQAAASGSADGEAVSEATGAAWAEATASVDAALESVDAQDEVALHAALMLAAGAFVDAR